MPATLTSRLLVYQAERFPVAAYLPLVLAGAFAAVAVSAAGRGGRVSWGAVAVAAATLLAFFFLLRVLDEHKDAAADRAARPELPVPRGLITLGELRLAAAAAIAFVALLNVWLAPRLLLYMALAGLWAGLMAREFFAPEWLRARPLAYLLSHMVIMPLLFLYATAADWLSAGAAVPATVPVFLGLAFANGLVIEIGRKLRAPEDERPGVDTYTSAWGMGPAVGGWIAAVVVAAGLAIATVTVAGAANTPVVALLVVAAAGVLLPAIVLLTRPEPGLGKRVELAAGVWVLASYLVLGLAAYAATGPGR